MSEKIRRPWDKRNIEGKKEEVDQSRRDFVKGVRTGAVIGVVGSVGGIALNKALKTLTERGELKEAVDVPARAILLQSGQAREALENSDPESVGEALEMINFYTKQLDEEFKHRAGLQKKLQALAKSEPNNGWRSLLVNGIQFSTWRQDLCIDAIKELRMAIETGLRDPRPGTDMLKSDKNRKVQG